jgi:hypothetical protein
MDVTNTEYLLTGNDQGRIVRYTGFQNGNVSTPYNILSDHYSDIQVGRRATITAGDIDKDGKTEFIIGNSLGGLYLYKQGPVVSVPEQLAAQGGCRVYPNPARSELIVSWEAQFATGEAPVEISLFNTLGQSLRSLKRRGGSGATFIDLSGLASGIYTCRVASAGKAVSLKVTVIE